MERTVVFRERERERVWNSSLISSRNHFLMPLILYFKLLSSDYVNQESVLWFSLLFCCHFLCFFGIVRAEFWFFRWVYLDLGEFGRFWWWVADDLGFCWSNHWLVCCDFVCLEEFRGGLLLIWVFVEDLSVKVGAFFLLFWIKSLVGVVSWSVDKNWCLVDSIFSCLRYVCGSCRFQWWTWW